ncbi:hypothetical protein ABZW18_06455 [Streptomyces sp. NPDC004647]|uniref:hypothetical protein n=1 Tax=Streptomyces sp. NPDC004647 TaxID=3154671 RepID=UPI0033BBE4AA
MGSTEAPQLPGGTWGLISFDMDDRLARELGKLQQHAAQISEVVSDMQRLMPEGASGSDAQGAVEVRVGGDGLPESITVTRDWNRRRRPEELGGAVAEACGAAMAEMMAAWAQGLGQSGWDVNAKRVDLSREEPDTTAQLPGTTDLRYVLPRRLDEVAEDVISSFENLRTVDAAATAGANAQAKGSDSSRHVSIALSPGALNSCEIDARWAEKQSSIRLNQAFEEALADVRFAMRQVDGSDVIDGARQRVGGLAQEALAILSDPRRIADI